MSLRSFRFKFSFEKLVDKSNFDKIDGILYAQNSLKFDLMIKGQKS